MQPGRNEIVLFLIVVTAIILLLAAFIITLIYLYQKKQISYQQKIDSIKLTHEKNIISAKLEMQEYTFQNISREIHDNISLSLTLAKLNLNTFDWINKEKGIQQLNSSVELLSRAITDLNDISKSLNSDIVSSQGLIRALETDIARIRLTGLYSIHFNVTGEPVYMDTQKELIIFRIIQEAFNNIIKHAGAQNISLALHYSASQLHITISDNGKGFICRNNSVEIQGKGAGLKNMDARSKMIGGSMNIKSAINSGTSLIFNIPFK